MTPIRGRANGRPVVVVDVRPGNSDQGPDITVIDEDGCIMVLHYVRVDDPIILDLFRTLPRGEWPPMIQEVVPTDRYVTNMPGSLLP